MFIWKIIRITTTITIRSRDGSESSGGGPNVSNLVYDEGTPEDFASLRLSESREREVSREVDRRYEEERAKRAEGRRRYEEEQRRIEEEEEEERRRQRAVEVCAGGYETLK